MERISWTGKITKEERMDYINCFHTVSKNCTAFIEEFRPTGAAKDGLLQFVCDCDNFWYRAKVTASISHKRKHLRAIRITFKKDTFKR